jgi:hypothetical protein
MRVMHYAPPLPPTTDPAVAYREVADFRAAFQARNWTAIRAVLGAVDRSGRTRLIWDVTSNHDTRVYLQELHDADPSDTLVAAMLGSCLVDYAWEIRTALRAEHVSREQFQRMHQILRRAEPILIDAAAYDPTDCAVWATRLSTAMGLELGQSESRRRYDRLAETDPHHLPAQSALLQRLAPKWGGSYDAMHAFALEAMRSAPPGAHNGSLVPEAHLEHLSWLEGEEYQRYCQDPRVNQEIREAGARSVLHPAFQRSYGWVGAHNMFAAGFSVIGDHAAAAPHFRAVGHLASEAGWSYFGDDSIAAFRKHRDLAFRAMGWVR